MTTFSQVRDEAKTLEGKGVNVSIAQEIVSRADQAETRHSGQQGTVQAKQITADVGYGVKTAMNMATLPFGFRAAMGRQGEISKTHDQATNRNEKAEYRSNLEAEKALAELRQELTFARNTSAPAPVKPQPGNQKVEKDQSA